MRFQVLSDLHLEIFPEHQRLPFLNELRHAAADVDAVVLAGDVASHELLRPTLQWFCEAYAEVVYVCGNHEYYGTSFEAVRGILKVASMWFPNLRVLDNTVAEVCSQRFVGATLWFPEQLDNDRYEHLLSDFTEIADFRRQVYAEAERAERFLRENVRPGDVVVTHHLPSHSSVHERYEGSQINRFFVHPLDALVEEMRPAVWVHGHTHLSCDYRLGETRGVCNPYGYWGNQENGELRRGLVIELG